MSRKRSEPSTFELLLKLPQQATALSKAEYANAKAEAGSALKKLMIGAICLIIALFFLFWAFAAFGASAILGLSYAVAPWLAALIVAGGLVALAAIAVLVGIVLVKRGNPVPEETLGRVGDDVHVATSVKVNAEPDARIHNHPESDERFGRRRGK